MSRCPVNYDKCHRETEKNCPTRTDDGTMMFCTLGKSSIPVPSTQAYRVYEITQVEDKVQITLSMTHRAYLRYISDRGGEAIMDYSEMSQEAGDHVRLLISMKVLTESPIVGTTKVIHRISDLGRNLLTTMNKSQG